MRVACASVAALRAEKERELSVCATKEAQLHELEATTSVLRELTASRDAELAALRAQLGKCEVRWFQIIICDII